MLVTDSQNAEPLRWILSIAVPAILAVACVLIGAWLTKRRDQFQRRHDFAERQLRDFYSPLLGIRSEIKMQSELRVRIRDTASEAWKELCKRAEKRGGEEGLEDFCKKRFPEFKKILEYNERQLVEDGLSSYKRMITIFRDNMWLAEPETRHHFNSLLEFVELWNRWLVEAIPVEVINAIGHDEERLQSFYRHLEDRHDELRTKLSKGDV